MRSCLLNGEWRSVEPPTATSASPPLGAWLSRQSKHGSGSVSHCRAMRLRAETRRWRGHDLSLSLSLSLALKKSRAHLHFALATHKASLFPFINMCFTPQPHCSRRLETSIGVGSARRSDSFPADTQNGPLKTPDAPCTVQSWAVWGRRARCSAEVSSKLSGAAKQIDATDDHFGVALAALAAAAVAVAAAAVAVAAAAEAAAAAGGEAMAGDVGEMLEVLEVLAAALSGEEVDASMRARFVGGPTSPTTSTGPTGPQGSDGCAAAADRRLRGHTALALALALAFAADGTAFRADGPIRQALPSRTQREQAMSGVTSHLTLERRQLMQASLISLVSPQGNCGGEGLRWSDSVRSGYGPLTESAPGEAVPWYGLLVGYGALRPTCRRAHRVHGPWSNFLEQETLDRLQFAQACSLERSSAAGVGGGCAATVASAVQGVSWHVQAQRPSSFPSRHEQAIPRCRAAPAGPLPPQPEIGATDTRRQRRGGGKKLRSARSIKAESRSRGAGGGVNNNGLKDLHRDNIYLIYLSIASSLQHTHHTRTRHTRYTLTQ